MLASAGVVGVPVSAATALCRHCRKGRLGRRQLRGLYLPTIYAYNTVVRPFE